ncbi:MAG: hypothetical protein ACPGRW_06150 [Flavobacteriaceae bacterium]
MANFLTAQTRAKQLKPAIVKRNLFKYVRSIEKLFIDLNIAQIEDSQDAKGELLENTDSRFSGVYSESTQGFADLDGISTKKTAGQPYNFLWTGDFIRGFELFIKNGDLELFSTGTGSGDKAAFFDGYQHLFGLTDENLRKIIDANLIPFLTEYYRVNLV